MRTVYREDGWVSSVTHGYGTAAAAAAAAATSYTANGQVAGVTDARGEVTGYGYDGLDRLSRTTWPGGSYEELGYDAGGQVTSRRLRDGRVIGYGYDAPGRRVMDDHPGAEADVGYAYDGLDMPVQATDGNGWSTGWRYDALGRVVRQEGNLSTTTPAYDAGGRPARRTWGDGFFVTYEYDGAGQVTAVRENGGLVLAAYGYDDAGRRTSVTRGNGTATTYSYDAAGRLSGLSHDLAGSAQDVSLGFGYNPAGQIASRTASNAAYGWDGAYAVERAYAVNGLNQYTQAGGTGFGYDANGNLTSSGSATFGYDSRNQLTSGPGAPLVYRGPTGLLGQVVAASGAATNFDHVGQELATEYVNGAVARRYVYGPGEDEPIVWYEGAGTSDRRYLHADERGSIIAVTNDTGQAIAINSYDEFGIPGQSNQGRFQYTGQKWIPELGLYDYKARMYSPTLGRFMQTDPTGYADGMNWYDYVGGDPVNGKDPDGLFCVQVEGHAADCGRMGGLSLGWGISFGGGDTWGGGLGSLRADDDPDEIEVRHERLPKTKPGGKILLPDGAPQSDDIVVTARRHLAKVLDNFAENYLKPPEGLQPSESFSDCMQRVAGGSVNTAIDGASAIGAGGNFIPYPRAVFSGASGTSIISTISRTALAFLPRMGSTRILGTNSVGGAVGRVASRASVYGGAAAIGFAGGTAVGAAQVCSK